MQTLLKLIVCASPSVYTDLAYAEVMDKLPQIPDFWLTSLLELAVAAVALKFHRLLFAATLVYPVFWFANTGGDFASPGLLDAILVEAGWAYIVNAAVAALVWLMGIAFLLIWKKRI